MLPLDVPLGAALCVSAQVDGVSDSGEGSADVFEWLKGDETLTPTSLVPGGGSMAKQALNNSLAKLNVKEDALFFR